MELENTIKSELLALFYSYFSEPVQCIEPITNSASSRLYFKMRSQNHNAIGTYCVNIEETTAFEYLTSVFKAHQLPVPEIYAINSNKNLYIQEFLGDDSLFQFIIKLKKKPAGEKTLLFYYKKVIDWLLQFQINTAKTIDYNKCFPIKSFNHTSIAWDLNYFKYYFLLPQVSQINELKLENDFQKIIDFIAKIDNQYFMYRDFQTRNILINNENLFFIDYQGGRQGPLYYDLVSLLLQAQINLSWEQRFHLMEYYFQQLHNYKIVVPKDTFENNFLVFALLRTFQVLGAYGYRGLIEKKEYFIKSIPFAINNLKQLKWEIQDKKIINLPYIFEITAILNDKFKLDAE